MRCVGWSQIEAVLVSGTMARFVASGATYLNTDRSSEYIPVETIRIEPRSKEKTGFLSLPA